MKKNSGKALNIILDTSGLVAFFCQPETLEANQIHNFLQTKIPCFIPDVVFSELEYVMVKKYQLSRRKFSLAIEFLLSQNQVNFQPYLPQTLVNYRHSRLDFSDCLIAAIAKDQVIATFDKKLLKLSQAKSLFT